MMTIGVLVLAVAAAVMPVESRSQPKIFRQACSKLWALRHRPLCEGRDHEQGGGQAGGQRTVLSTGIHRDRMPDGIHPRTLASSRIRFQPG